MGHLRSSRGTQAVRSSLLLAAMVCAALLTAALSGCRHDLDVPRPGDGPGPDVPGVDAAGDAPADAPDARPDVPVDLARDAGPDGKPDAPQDLPADMGPDKPLLDKTVPDLPVPDLPPPDKGVPDQGKPDGPVTPQVLKGLCSKDKWCWVNPLPGEYSFKRMWGSGPSDLYLLADVGTFKNKTVSRIFHHDGKSFKDVTPSTSKLLTSIRGNSATNVHVVGEGGTWMKYNGGGWSTVTTGVTSPLRDAWIDAGGEVFVVGDAGLIMNMGKFVTTMTSNTFVDLYGVWGSDAKNVFTAGKMGTILRWDGSKWSKMVTNTSAILRRVWGTAKDDVFAVGDGGVIMPSPPVRI